MRFTHPVIATIRITSCLLHPAGIVDDLISRCTDLYRIFNIREGLAFEIWPTTTSQRAVQYAPAFAALR